MRSADHSTLRTIVRDWRRALRSLASHWRFRLTRRVAGQFQPYNYTRPDRYPWLFGFAAAELRERPQLRILSFGCSRGEELFSLRRYFPSAHLKGIDINARNIARAVARTRTDKTLAGIRFETAASTVHEPDESYDAIFCLAVLCLGDLTIYGAKRSDPALRFEDFARAVADFARCLKPGGLLVLHTTNYRFCDTPTAAQFDTVLEAEPSQLAPDVLFDRNNALMPNERYTAVAFRKRPIALRHADPTDE
jgi:SAM-dependent methyltransferase